MKTAELELKTHRFREMKDFYSNVLGFKLVATDEGLFKVQTGSSILTFKGLSDDVQPFYHFAFNITENQIVYLAKQIRGSDWQTLTIPRGKSREYLDNMFNVSSRVARTRGTHDDGNKSTVFAVYVLGIPRRLSVPSCST